MPLTSLSTYWLGTHLPDPGAWLPGFLLNSGTQHIPLGRNLTREDDKALRGEGPRNVLALMGMNIKENQ
jgi:hypothetical protein